MSKKSRLQACIAGGSVAMMVGVGVLGPVAQAGATTTDSDDTVLVDADETVTTSEASDAPAESVAAQNEDDAGEESTEAAAAEHEAAEEPAAQEAAAEDAAPEADEVDEADDGAEVSDPAQTEVVTQHESDDVEELVVEEPAEDEADEGEADEGEADEDGSATDGIIDGWLEGLDSGAGRCDGDQTYALAEIFLAQGYNRRFIMQGDVRLVDLTTAMEAGEYVVDTYSWDEHENRPYDTPQASERYYVEFVDADGNVVGSTGATTDLPDDVVRGESYDTFEVTLTGTAVEMRIIHIQDYITTGSVVPGCLSISAVVEPEPEPETPPTTTPPTTTPPVTTPPVTTPPATTPPTTAAPTTTAPQVEVDDNTATLPYTGSNAMGLTIVGGSLIVTGLGFTLISRRRLGALS